MTSSLCNDAASAWASSTPMPARFVVFVGHLEGRIGQLHADHELIGGSPRAARQTEEDREQGHKRKQSQEPEARADGRRIGNHRRESSTSVADARRKIFHLPRPGVPRAR